MSMAYGTSDTHRNNDYLKKRLLVKCGCYALVVDKHKKKKTCGIKFVDHILTPTLELSRPFE